MGARKRLMAERLKEIKKQTAIAKLNNDERDKEADSYSKA